MPFYAAWFILAAAILTLGIRRAARDLPPR